MFLYCLSVYMQTFNFQTIIEKAWRDYDDTKQIQSIIDVSAEVSTNHVFKINFLDRSPVFVKLSYYGNFEHFKEDHVIINNLANNLESPYENFLARSLVKKNEVFTYRYKQGFVDTWAVIYNPVKIRRRLPRKLDEKHIIKLGSELAMFHKACSNIRNVLSPSSKTLTTDIEYLLNDLQSGSLQNNKKEQNALIRGQCTEFLRNSEELKYETSFVKIPVFVDWNISNFSITGDGKFYSRWDYDWFRMASRVVDFYFFSRVVSERGDRTVFSYSVDTLMEDRFMLFLKEYHKVFPLTESEVRFIKEAYRFFILNYVIKDGDYFFHEIYASKLQKEAYELYFPSLDEKFDDDKILRELKI
jgi:hypothetical protein